MVAVNFIPDSLVVAQVRRRHLIRWTTAGAVSVALLAMPVAVESYRVTRVERLQEEVTVAEAELARVQRGLASIVATSEETYLQIERAQALRSKRSWSGIIGLIASTMPEGAWLFELATDPAVPRGGQSRGRKDGAGASKASDGTKTRTVVIEAPQALRLEGYATDASEPLLFVSRLKETEAFRSVSLLRSQREPIADGFYYRFEIVCRW